MKTVSRENENLRSRLYNFKFDQALLYIKGEDEDIQQIVKALAAIFGDVGWGLGGNLESLIDRIVFSLLGDLHDDNSE